jgi:hypothetical protein
VDLAIPAAVAGPRGPRAVAAGEAWVPAGSAAVDLAAAVAGGAAADFEVVAAVGAKAGRNSMTRRNNGMFWGIEYVPPSSESQT